MSIKGDQVRKVGITVLSPLRRERQGCSLSLFHSRSILHCWSPPPPAYYTVPNHSDAGGRFPCCASSPLCGVSPTRPFLEAPAATAHDPDPDPGPDRQRSTMRIFVYDLEEEGGVDEARNRSLVVGCRFACDELYLSDSDDESDLHDQSHLMDKVGVVEGAFYELSHKHQAAVKEAVRNQISALEIDVMDVRRKSASAIVWVEKYIEARREMDRKIDILYRHNIAEALDNYMAIIQRDHEYRSQMEETRIRNEAAFEETRKEKILQEEKLCQEKAKAEAKVVLELAAKKRAKEAKIRASEDERSSKKYSAGRKVLETSTGSATKVAPNEVNGHQIDASLGIPNAQLSGSDTDGTKKAQSAGNILKCARTALELEQERLQKYKEFDEKAQVLRQRSNKDFQKHEISFVPKIRQISGHKVSIRKRGNELINMLKNPLYPEPISVAVFVKKFVSYFEEEKPPRVTFPCGHAIVFITSQVPYAMDFLLAELNRVCIYTVPKHIDFAESAFQSEEDYHKRIGYQEENGTMESTENYLKRLESYMSLYAVLIQTETGGVQNPHGLREGWAWLARFLNALPANVYTGVALNVFLKIAGFALYRKYRCQFKKILKFISGNFVVALKAQRERVTERQLNVAIVEIESYIRENEFLQEPEGWRLEGSLLSQSMVIQ